jgi:uncharacterized membrane protein YuzA (DUF378 family)
MILIIGGLNLGFTALLGFDPLAPILGGSDSLVTKIIYAAVGVSAVYVFYAYLMTPGGEDIEEHRRI